MRPRTSAALLSLFLGLSSTALPVQAERRSADAGDAVRRAQMMVHKLSLEKDELQAKNAELGTQVKKLEDTAAGLESELRKIRAKLGAAEQNNERLVERIRGDVEKYKELLERYRAVDSGLREALGNNRIALGDNRLLVNAVRERERWIEQCRAQNEKMYETNLELLDRYQRKGVADVLKDNEPVLGIWRVELENTVQDYQFRLEDLQVTPFQAEVPARQAYAEQP